MFERRGYIIIIIGVFVDDNFVVIKIVYQCLVVIKMIGGGDGGMIIVECFMKIFSYGGEDLIMVVKKQKFEINVLEWMVE